MIDLFPAFSKLELNHKPNVDKIVDQFPPFSDFNFISLYSWNTDNSTSISLLNSNLVIEQSDYITGKPVLSLLGKNKIDDSLITLLKKSEVLKLVPETTVKSIKNSALFSVVEDLDNYDYLYALPEIVELKGAKFKKIRNKLNGFKKMRLEDVVVQTSNTIDKSAKQQFIQLFDSWAKTAKRSSEDSETEKKALVRLLDAPDSHVLLYTTVWEAEHLIAFNISEVLVNNYAICHFEKALSSFENLTTFIAHEGAKALLDKGVQLVNWEQDLGLEGLRHSKSNWQPNHFLKKYTITLKK